MHPDRFNRATQNAEWELANEFLKELNCAYALLRDPRSRISYDRVAAQKAAGAPPPRKPPVAPPPEPEPQPKKAPEPPPPKVAEEPPPSTNPYLGEIRSGYSRFSNLPRVVQQRLKVRAAGKNKMQFMAKTDDITGKYTLVLLVFVALVYSVSGFEFKAGGISLPLGVVFLSLSFLFSYYVDWMVRWRQSHIHCWMIVTPVYLVKTNLDQVWYWPVSDVSEVKAAPRWSDLLKRRQTVDFKIGSKLAREEFVYKDDVKHVLSAIRVYQERLKLAESRKEWKYFQDENDFREVFSSKRKGGRSVYVFLLCFLFCGLLPVAFGFLNKAYPRRVAVLPARPAVYSAEPKRVYPKVEERQSDIDRLKSITDNGAGEIPPPFQLRWGEKMPPLERFIAAAGGKVLRRRPSDKGVALEVKGMDVDGLDRALFYCNDGVLTGVELRYHYPDGGDGGWDRRLMSSLIARFEELYGSGITEFKYDSELAISSEYRPLVGMMWRGTSGGTVQLFNLVKREKPEGGAPVVVLTYGFTYRY